MPAVRPTLFRPLIQAAGRRQFSIVAKVRQVARSAEPHPFERYPVTQQAQRGDYGKLARHVGDAAMFYFPALAFFLGWPLLAEKVLDGHMGDM